MKAGAFGISTGLIYTPGVYADITEIIELSKIVASYSGIYFSHIRGEGATLLEAVREAIGISEQATSIPTLLGAQASAHCYLTGHWRVEEIKPLNDSTIRQNVKRLRNPSGISQETCLLLWCPLLMAILTMWVNGSQR